MRKIIAIALLGGAALAACGNSGGTKHASTAANNAATSTTAPAVAVGTRADAKLGTLLVDSRGMTLYRNTKDRPGAFACSDACLATWPPLLAPAGVMPTTTASLPGTLATVARPDGTMQVTYNGWPLYLFANDQNAGETNGQGVGGIWFVVSPTVAAVSASSATTMPTTIRTVTTARAVTATTASHPASTAATSPPSSEPATTSPPNTMATMPGYGY